MSPLVHTAGTCLEPRSEDRGNLENFVTSGALSLDSAPLLTMKLPTALAAFAAMFLFPHLAGAARLPLSLVAVPEATAFDRGGDFKNQGMQSPVCGRNGLVTFTSGVNYVGSAPPLSVNRYSGVYQGSPGGMHWGNPGGPYPLSGNSYFLPQNVPAINSAGLNLITASFADNPAGVYPTIYGYGVMRGNGASAQLIYRDGDPAPGLSGVLLNGPDGSGNGVNDDSLNLNDSGRVTVLTHLTGNGVNGKNRSAIWFTDTPGTLNLVARTGNAAPGGDTFTALGPPATADDGSIAFGARTSGDFFNSAWVRSPAGTLSPLVRVGDSLPEAGTGAVCSAVPGAGFQLATRADGATAFFASYTLPGQQEQGGIFIGKPGAIQAIALDSMNAPGTPGNFFLIANPTNVSTSLRINDSGTIVFVANWYRPMPYAYGSGIFAYRNGSLAQVVASGAPAIDGPPGASFRTFSNSQIVLNNKDQLVFQADMTGGGTSSGNQAGIWGLDLATGTLSLIVRNQEMLEIQPGVTIQATGIASGGAPHRPRGGGSGTALSDTGRYVFQFADGTIMTAEFPAAAGRLAAWRQTYFGSPDNSGPGADNAVSSIDGLPNLVHYALGLPPSANARTDGSAPASSVGSGGGSPRARVVFIRDPAATDVRLSASVSTDLIHWNEGNVYHANEAANANPFTSEISRETLPDGRQRITLETAFSSSSAFLRLGATSL